MKTKLKSFVIPIIQHGSFGAECYVSAEDLPSAIAKALAGDGEILAGFDWDRWDDGKVELGDWSEIEEQDDEGNVLASHPVPA